MDMILDTAQYQEGRLEQRPAPTLVAFAQLLVLSSNELQQVIRQATRENPALELAADEDSCARCGERLIVGLCPRCDGLGDDDWRGITQRREFEEDFDPFQQVASQVSLSEALLRDLVVALPREDHLIAEYLCGSLDESGFLDTSTAEVAAILGVAEERVESVLETLQHIGPLGVGARGVRECLDIQLQYWEAAGSAPPLARPIITHYLTELARGKYGYIALRLRASYDEIVAARDFIRDHLRPFPVADHSTAEPWCSVNDTGFIVPDILITESEHDQGEYEVTVVESRRAALRVNPLYLEILEALDGGRSALSASEAEHVRRGVTHAMAFIGHIHERHQTMKRVTIYVVDRQKDFLRHGWRELRPLTRAEVAAALGLHESTVSRATAGKYVMLPNRQVIPFANIFQAALSVHDVLREVITRETRPLTDAQLKERLDEAGYHVARRTVAKYRTQMGILPSPLR